jgi:hypothetical protein
MKLRVRLGMAAVLLAACAGLAGCAQIEQPSASDAEPAQIHPIGGTDLNRVVLTEEASQNLGIRTVPVVEDTSSVPAARVGVATTAKRPTTPAARRRAAAAARRLAARAAAQRTPKMTVVPLTAVIYDPQGVAWVYTATAARTFVRTKVVIDHTSSGIAYLSSGPAVGSAAVTVGASELLGAEYGVGGE